MLNFISFKTSKPYTAWAAPTIATSSPDAQQADKERHCTEENADAK